MRKTLTFFLLSVFALPMLHAAGRDVSGSRDHELISRYGNSVIIGYQQRDFDSFRLPLGTPKRDRKEIKMENYLDLEGRLTIITYELKESASTLKVLRNFEKALQGEGFEEMFQCEGKQCGSPDVWDELMQQVAINNGKQATIRFMAAKMSREKQGIYIGVYVMETYGNKVLVGLNVIETKAMETGLVEVNADALRQQLAKNGKVAVYGIRFDTDKAEIKPESFATLEMIKQLLEMKQDLNLYIVGHTDDTGRLTHNIDLSKRRAEAVVQALVNRYGISPRRLAAFGAGPYAPVASNLDPEGQSKNRRVELVQRLD